MADAKGIPGYEVSSNQLRGPTLRWYCINNVIYNIKQKCQINQMCTETSGGFDSVYCRKRTPGFPLKLVFQERESRGRKDGPHRVMIIRIFINWHPFESRQLRDVTISIKVRREFFDLRYKYMLCNKCSGHSRATKGPKLGGTAQYSKRTNFHHVP